MPTYSYVGRDLQGVLVKGKLRAKSPEAVATHLSTKDILPISITVTSDKLHFSLDSLKALGKINIGSGKPTSNEMIALGRNIGVMLEAGIAIVQIIQELAKASKSARLKKALFAIAESIQGGETLTLSLKKYPDLFSPLYVNTIAIGENTGNLAESFTRLAKYLEMEEDNIKRLRSALRYPKFVISAILIAVLVINVVVVPPFKKIFESFSAKLPWPTRVLMTTSNFITHNWHFAIGLFILFMIILRASLRNPRIRFAWDRAKLSLPLLGPLIKKIMLTRFIWSLALMLKSGSPMLHCLDLVSSSSGNYFIKNKIEAVKKYVENGKSFSDSIRKADILGPIDLQMLIVGEESGNLDGMLEKIANEYDKETAYELKRFGDYIEPLLLLFLGAMVGILALAVFLPLWDLGKVAIK